MTVRVEITRSELRARLTKAAVDAVEKEMNALIDEQFLAQDAARAAREASVRDLPVDDAEPIARRLNARLSAAKVSERGWVAARDAKRIASPACEVCGYSAHVVVHHIRPRSPRLAAELGVDAGGHTLDNLITLCPNHHAEAHARMAAVQTPRKTNPS